MNRKLTLALAALILTGTALPAFAEEGAAGGPRHDGPRKDRGAKMFEEADADKNGEITKEEMRQHHEKKIEEIFSGADTDKSGTLTKPEIDAGREKMREKWKAMKDRKGDRPGDNGPPSAPPEDGDKPE